MRFGKLFICFMSLLLADADGLAAGKSASFAGTRSSFGSSVRIQSPNVSRGSISVTPLGPSRAVPVNPALTQKSSTDSSLKAGGGRPVDTGSLYRQYQNKSNPPPPPAYNPWAQSSSNTPNAGANRPQGIPGRMGGGFDPNYSMPNQSQRKGGMGMGHVLAGAAAGALLTHMLESTAQASDREQYRRHYNDPDVVASRRSQMAAAANDPELKRKLEELDTQMKTPVGKLCAGLPQGAYAKVAATLNQSVPVETVTTTGSVDNVQRVMDGRCDIGFVQRDVLVTHTGQAVKTASDFMLETLLLLCGKDKTPTSLAEMAAETRVAIPEQSGASATWDILAQQVPSVRQSVKIEAMTPNDAISSISSGKADCAFVVTHPDSGIAGFADTQGGLHLVPIRSADLPKGMAENAYLPVSISGKRFKSLAHSKWVDGFAVETILIVNEAWQKEHLPAFDNILLALQGVRSSMEGHK